ncbi:Tetraacyldisaccharide 4'-kinase [Rhynchospora pubera]|uniref:tetraacyldisaccharide 4'-kinase n=1 Tax=Rhynchospora pubera TaxID=906938 RepID=A0AAV8EW52_9POAL|nr:Tetraacyldisaccharide 4'-kinase [Rhynchospora pubera]
MERVKKAIIRMAATPDRRLPLGQRCLVAPVLSAASSLYGLCVSLRRALYSWQLLRPLRLPLPVISVGNLTWGGTGKTPMVLFLSRFFLHSHSCTPLILTRGYAGADEASMLKRHLSATSAVVAVGKNRARLAASLLRRFPTPKLGVVILDDGMQHWSLARQVEIIMINALMPWGNGHLLPRGPLREPLHALQRAHLIVIHHANLVSEAELKTIESTILRICSKTIPVFFSELVPSHFFEINSPNEKLPLSTVHALVVLCVSAIGCPDSFVKALIQIGALHIHRLDFTDHHALQTEDIKLITDKIRSLALVHDNKAAIVVTEKDYDRDPAVLQKLGEFKILVLCSSFRIMTFKSKGDEGFKAKLKELVCKSFANNTSL